MKKQLEPKPERWYTESLTALSRVSEAVYRLRTGDLTSLAEILQMITRSARELTQSVCAAIMPYDADILSFNQEGVIGSIPEGLSLSDYFPESLARQAIYEHSSLFTNDRPDGIHFPGGPLTACYPLFANEIPVGVLFVVNQERSSFTTPEKLFLSNLANLSTAAIQEGGSISDIQKDLNRKEEELQQLHRASMLISSRLKLEETLEAILNMALEVTGAQYGIFRLVDKTGKQLVTRAVAGLSLDRLLVEALPLDSNSVMGWVAQSRKPILITDLRDEPWRNIYYPFDPGLEMRSELAVPLIGATGRMEGVLNLESRRVGAFSDQDRRLLQSLATQAVIAIQEVRLLDVLQEVAQLLLTQSSQRVLKRLAEYANDLLNGDTSAIWMTKDNQLNLMATYGSPLPEDQSVIPEIIAGKVIASRNSILASNMTGWKTDLMVDETPFNILAVPIFFSKSRQPTGVFEIFNTHADNSSLSNPDWGNKVLNSLAYYAALAVQNDSRQEALRAAQDQRAVAETFAAVGDIAANVLHQLNNKVGSIPVRIQGIRDKSGPSLKKDNYLNTNLTEIEKSANEAMQSVRENLAQLGPITMTEINVARCIHTALEEAQLPEGIKLELSSLENLPAVTAAQRSLSLVFTNLLINASDAMGGNGQITISGRADNGWVEIAICDDGPGIPPEFHSKVFELNYSSRSQQKASKLGFGLWWVKTLLMRLGGSISLESDGKHGTTFLVRLPVSEIKS